MMTELFTREGTAHTGAHATTEKGRAFFTRARTCWRCGGAGGADKWAHTGWTCFDCGGAGTRGTETVKLFTADQLAKLNATAAKRAAKKQAAADAAAAVAAAEAAARAEAFNAQHGALLDKAEQFAERSEFIKDVVRKARRTNLLTDAQAEALAASVARIEASDAAKAASRHVGQIGQRLTFTVTVERVAEFFRPSFSGFGREERVNVITMRDENGNAIVSMSPSFCAAKGEKLVIKATVKEHKEFRGEEQTMVQRVKEIEVIETDIAKAEASQSPAGASGRAGS